MRPPDQGELWIDLVDHALPVAAAYEWVVRPDCGAAVVFSGTARDHSDGRPDVTVLEYEAYTEQVIPRFERIVDTARRRWPDVRRVCILHRTGPVPVGESSVVVAVSSPHRDAAFEAARWCIDTLKTTVPIWKREVWAGGESWGLDATDVSEVPGAGASS